MAIFRWDQWKSRSKEIWHFGDDFCAAAVAHKNSVSLTCLCFCLAFLRAFTEIKGKGVIFEAFSQFVKVKNQDKTFVYFPLYFTFHFKNSVCLVFKVILKLILIFDPIINVLHNPMHFRSTSRSMHHSQFAKSEFCHQKIFVSLNQLIHKNLWISWSSFGQVRHLALLDLT